MKRDQWRTPAVLWRLRVNPRDRPDLLWFAFNRFNHFNFRFDSQLNCPRLLLSAYQRQICFGRKRTCIAPGKEKNEAGAITHAYKRGTTFRRRCLSLRDCPNLLWLVWYNQSIKSHQSCTHVNNLTQLNVYLFSLETWRRNPNGDQKTNKGTFLMSKFRSK